MSIDTLRADRLGCFGYESAQSPTIDGLAAEGILFEAASSVSPLTLPAHASMLTGRYPHEHGARNNGIPPTGNVEFVAEQLRDVGYSTAAAVSAGVLDARFGLARGFDVYDDDIAEGAVERSSPATTNRALEHWTAMVDAPRFLWVHYFDPHHPYEPDLDWEGEDPYDGEIARVDRELGRLLAQLRADSPEAVVILLADHGEAFGEHDEREHGMLLYETTIHVPLILSDPRDRERAGTRVEHPVSTIDVAATIRELAGVAAESIGQANSLKTPTPGRALISETLVPFYNHSASPLASVRVGDRKYIEAPRAELYDLSRDPQELENLIASADADELSRRLKELHPLEWLNGTSSRAGAHLDADSKAMLSSLGYLGGSSELVALTDPKDVVVALGEIRRADGAIYRAEAEEAERLLRSVLMKLPDNWSATWKLSDLLVEQRRYDDAETVLAMAANRNPRNLSIWLRVGRLYRFQERFDESLQALERICDSYPEHPEANIEYARTLAAQGKRDAALAWLRELSERTGDPVFREAMSELSRGER